MSGTGYVWDARCLGHVTSKVHAERPERMADLAPDRLLGDLPGLRRVATDAALGMPWVQRVHDAAYLETVRSAWRERRRALDPSGETVVREDTFDVALLSAAGALSLVAQVCRGSLRNGFAAVRPPGHHARSFFTRGFCIFNNVAACARFAQQAFGLRRVLVVDWDVHPADGTQQIFWEDSDVHVLSVHQDGIFARAVGTADQRGAGAGEGATYNLPVAPRTRGDAYIRAFVPLLERAAEACQPDLVLVSCGFDAHLADPVGGLGLEDEDFRSLTRRVMEVADAHAGGRIVSVLEGGYSPRALARCVRLHLETLMTP